MKRLLLMMPLWVLTFGASAQLHKKFFNKKGTETKDSTKANSYILYQKYGPDSLWSAVAFDMHNVPLIKGVYVDEELTIPYGKFVYYQQVITQHKVDEHQSAFDTVLSIKQSGFYVNGKKEGIWMQYNPDGTRRLLRTFEKDTLNGEYKEYYNNDSLFCKGNVVNGRKEGDWYYYRGDSLNTVLRTTKFWHDNPYKTNYYSSKDIYYAPYPGYDFSRYVFGYLKKVGIASKYGHVVLSITITADGKVTKPAIKMGMGPIVDQALSEAISRCKPWYPARKNGKAIEEEINIVVHLGDI